MKIVMRYDAGTNGFVLSEQECEGVPAAAVTAKAYCEYGTSPTTIVVEVPGTIVTPEEEALVREAMDDLKAEVREELENRSALKAEIAKLNVVIEEMNTDNMQGEG